MTTTRPPENDLGRRGSAFSGSFLPLLLITLGVVFLLGNVFQGPSKGGLVLLGLAAAFAIGRLTTGRYGYAVPAGILGAIGCFVTLQDWRSPQPLQSGGWFFVLLGLGFAAVYFIGMRPSAVWPLFPATVLIVLGVMLFGFTSLAPLANFAWIVSYWPAVLVLIGAWLLFRDHLPRAIRQPLGTFGGLALLVYGLLAAATSIAAGGVFTRNGAAPSFGSTSFSDQIVLDQPVSAGGTLTINNSSGPTSIRGGTGSTVHVMATRHFSVSDHPPTVALTPAGTGLTLEMSDANRQPFGGSSWVEYRVEVPSGVQVVAHATSGQLDVDGVRAAVKADTTSGLLHVTNIDGSVDARAGSGTIQLENITGVVKAQVNSGAIRATGVQHLTDAEASSGAISIDGVFAEAAKVKTTSGAVQLTMGPNSAVNVDIKTDSGAIQTHNVVDTSQSSRGRLTGRVGSPADGAVLSIETNSGAVALN